MAAINIPSSSNISSPMELVSAAAFTFRKPSASLDDTKEFLDSVSKNFKRAKELNFSTISKFTLNFPFQIQLGTSRIGDIIDLALQFKVKELNLILTNKDLNVNSSFDLFQLPADFFNENTFLKKMNLAMCSFSEIHETIKWDSLTQLKLAHTCLDKIDKIAEGCPVLEELRLFECWGFEYLNFQNHKTLKALRLDGVWCKSKLEFDILAIWAPTVRVLEITGDLNSRYVILKDISGCISANIGFHWTSGDHVEDVEKDGFSVYNLRQILDSLKRVWSVTFGTWFIEVLSRKLYDNFTFDLPICTDLTLCTPVDDRYECGMLRLLESCPLLSTVNIEANRTHPLCEICPNGICIHDISKSTNEISPSSSSSNYQKSFGFKTLKFSNSEAATSQVGDLPVFVENLIKNSRHLNKVILA